MKYLIKNSADLSVEADFGIFASAEADPEEKVLVGNSIGLTAIFEPPCIPENINWEIQGPVNFSGSGNSISYSPPQKGQYNVEASIPGTNEKANVSFFALECQIELTDVGSAETAKAPVSATESSTNNDSAKSTSSYKATCQPDLASALNTTIKMEGNVFYFLRITKASPLLSGKAEAKGDFQTNNNSRTEADSLDASQATTGFPEITSGLWSTKVNGLNQISTNTEYTVQNSLDVNSSAQAGVTAQAQGKAGPPLLDLKINSLAN